MRGAACGLVYRVRLAHKLLDDALVDLLLFRGLLLVRLLDAGHDATQSVDLVRLREMVVRAAPL